MLFLEEFFVEFVGGFELIFFDGVLLVFDLCFDFCDSFGFSIGFFVIFLLLIVVCVVIRRLRRFIKMNDFIFIFFKI